MLAGCVHPVKMASAEFCQILCCAVAKKSWYLIAYSKYSGQTVGIFLCFDSLHPSQQLWSCRDGQFTLTTLFLGHA